MCSILRWDQLRFTDVLVDEIAINFNGLYHYYVGVTMSFTHPDAQGKRARDPRRFYFLFFFFFFPNMSSFFSFVFKDGPTLLGHFEVNLKRDWKQLFNFFFLVNHPQLVTYLFIFCVQSYIRLMLSHRSSVDLLPHILYGFLVMHCSCHY